MYWEPEVFRPEEVLEYLRKSRSDDPMLTVAEVLQRHETILADWQDRFLEGGRIPEENIYREVVSGETIAGRPEFMKLLRRLESPSIKAVLVVEVQRMSRGDLEDCGKLIKILRYTNTKVITPMHTYNLNDEYDREAFERELKRGNDYLEYSKRIMSRGRLQSVMDGYFIGSVPPYGYNKVFVTVDKKRRPTLEINEEEARVVRLVFDMYAYQNMGFHAIANKLDELGVKTRKGYEYWSPMTIKEMLRNEHYIGKIRWNWRHIQRNIVNMELVISRPKSADYVVVQGQHEPIIDETTWKDAIEKRGRCSKKPTKTKVRNPLSSLLFCQCGTGMTYQTYKSSQPRLVCPHQHHCNNASVSLPEIYEAVCESLESFIEDFEIKMNATDESLEEMQRQMVEVLQRKYDDLCDKEISLWEKYAENAMPQTIFDRLHKKNEAEKQIALDELEKAKQTIIPRSVYQSRIALFSEALSALRDNEVSAEKKNNLLKACIKKITYSRKPSYRITAAQAKELGLKASKGWITPPFELDITLNF